MSWDYRRRIGEMQDLIPIQVDAVIRIVCTGSPAGEGERLHAAQALGELVRTSRGWVIGDDKHLTLRVKRNGQVIRSGDAERQYRDELLAQMAPAASARHARQAFAKADRLASGRAYWDPEVLSTADETAVEVGCPACRLDVKLGRILSLGKFDAFIEGRAPIAAGAEGPPRWVLPTYVLGG